MPLFTKRGGLLISEAIRMSDIRKLLAGEYPIILNIENASGGGHYVVVRGVGRKMMTISCPRYGLKKRSIKNIMKACYNWSGGAILARPSN